jgi:ferredoxin
MTTAAAPSVTRQQSYTPSGSDTARASRTSSIDSDCFHEGENFLAIDPLECIDCGVCEAECPANAIFADNDPRTDGWKEINARYAPSWPVIRKQGTSPADAEEWKDKPDKAALLSPNPARR